MKQEIENSEWIESYLNGDLTADEETAFKIKMGSDPDFARVVDQHRQMRDIITDGVYLHMKNEMRTIHLQKTKSVRRIRRITGFGLGVIVVTVILLQILPKSTVGDKNKIGPSPAAAVREDTNKPTQPVIPMPEGALAVNGKTNQPVPPKEKVIIDQNTQNQIISIDSSVSAISFQKEIADNSQKPRTDKSLPLTGEKEDQNVGKISVPDCRKVKITGDFTVSESCNDKPTGSIAIDRESVTGGQAPYTISLSQANFRDTLHFSGLYPGSYALYVKDANHCISRIGTALIRSMDCVSTYQAVFSPLMGEVWTVPIDPDRSGTIRIFSKNGELVYSVRFPENEPVTWNGTTLSGQSLPMGVYHFEIFYDNENRFRGNVTILR